MTKPKHFVAEVNQDQRSVRITMGKEELTLNAAEMDVLITELARRRALLVHDPVPHQLEPNPVFVPVSNPAFAVGVQDKERKHMMLTFRHPGFGWQFYLLPLDKFKHLAEAAVNAIRMVEPVAMPTKKIIMPGR